MMVKLDMLVRLAKVISKFYFIHIEVDQFRTNLVNLEVFNDN